jgi:hypothetical protein
MNNRIIKVYLIGSDILELFVIAQMTRFYGGCASVPTDPMNN